MFRLTCSSRSEQFINMFNLRGIQPRILVPIFNSSTLYSSNCNPCGGSPSAIKRCSPQKPKSPHGKGPCGGGGHNICYTPYVVKGYMDHDYKNMALNRPMSPHLQIFTMTVPAAMSIWQRATGVILTAYALLLAGGTLFLSNGIETYVSILQSLEMSELTVNILKLCLGLPFAYHYFNGIRFCIWNTARFLEMKQVNFTAMLAMVGTLVGAGVFAFYY